MRTRLVCILVLAGLVTQAAAQSGTFTRRDVAVGDPKVSYGSTEFTPDWKYLVWGEYAADGTDNMVMWHCEMNPDTGDLIPPDGKGFRAFDSTGWGRATAGRDSQGVNYVGMNRAGQLVLVRPTSATTGTVTILPTAADITRRAIYVTDLPEEPGQNGYVFWIKNEHVAGGPGDSRNSWVELRYISLANPSVEAVLQHQDRPPGTGGFAPLDIAFPRWFRGRAALTSGIRDANGHVQVVEFDFTQGTPTPRTVTSDASTKADAFPWTFGDQDILMSGTTDGTGATNIYTRPVGTQFFTPVETITPSTATLTPPVFAQSNERMSFGGLPFTSFQVNSGSGDFFGTTFGETGEIWLSTILQTPQQQWRLSEDSDTVKFENEPYVGRSKVWVFYSSVPKGSNLRRTVISLRRAETPLSTASIASLSVALALNRETVEPGGILQISVTAVNSGGAVVADVYLMAALPPDAGPQLGCPNEDALAFVVDGGAAIVLACASDPADTFPPYFNNFTIPAGLNVSVPNFLSLVWPSGAPPGPYTIEIFATPVGALADGVLGDENILVSALDTLTFVP